MAKPEDADDIIQKWVDAAGLDADKAIRAAVLDLYANVIKNTPVDTGRLRGNWQIGIDQVPKGETSRKYEGGKLGQENSTANTKAESELGKVTIKKDTTVYLANNLDYAPAIEYGLGKNRKEFAMLRKSVKNWKYRIAEKIKEAMNK